MSLTGVAALIAAVSFAVIACAAVYLALRFTRVLGDAATLVREARADSTAMFERANAAAAVGRAPCRVCEPRADSCTFVARSIAAVDRASAQLDSTEASTAAVAGLGDSM